MKIKSLITAASLVLLLTPGVSAQGLSASTGQLSPAQQKIALAQAAQVLPFIYHLIFFGMAVGLYLVWAARQPRTA